MCGVGFLSDPWCIFSEIGVVKRVVCSFQSLYSFGVLAVPKMLVVGFSFNPWCIFDGIGVFIVLGGWFLSDSRYLIGDIGEWRGVGCCSNSWYTFVGIGVTIWKVVGCCWAAMLLFGCWSDS